MQISCCRSQDPSGRESCQLWKKHTQCFWKSLYFPILSYMLDFNSISFCQYQKLKALLPLFSSFNLKQIFYNHILEKEDAHHYPHSPFFTSFLPLSTLSYHQEMSELLLLLLLVTLLSLLLLIGINIVLVSCFNRFCCPSFTVGLFLILLDQAEL